MSDGTTFEPETQSSDWRLSFGLALTMCWLLLGTLYIANVVGWLDFARQPAPELGGFLEGAFAPLAFLWLVIGFFLQQKQLSDNTLAVQRQYQALQRSAEQAEIQSRAIAANELHARQDTFLDVARMVSTQLGVIAGYLWMSALEDGGERQAIAELWTQLGLGDHATFSRLTLARIYGGDGSAEELFWSTPVRTRHSEHFIATFDRLMRQAEACDSEGMIADALRADAHGRIYDSMIGSRPGASAGAPA